ncbi:acetylglutamate kinase [Desulfurispira natronophila]|uniref:Acetylglutamate kinase n=1 Tax=Desulfurispira natronophila TaxID=682562 RepID=A0A7W7Y487_9BACT|nr:acetylglutamate kinase [Desulfurispira natronophila]MBB5021742.1 acetylglutamate kinase [Desulfurispira natronophila]
MEKLIEKASVLMESLPYIQSFYGKTIVIKYGGNAMVDEVLKRNFALDIILMKYIGINPIIVHGGGPQIGETLKRMGKATEFVDGMRVTDRDTMSIVEMVLVGKVNKEIVGLINQNGGKAVGLSGRDGQLIRARKHYITKPGPADKRPEIIDIGMVGVVDAINPQVLDTLASGDFIPVIAPVGEGEDGRAYNINADFVAGSIAAALKASKMVLLTDIRGVQDGEGNLLTSLTLPKVDSFIADGTIHGGMIPKVEACRIALDGGVNKVHIIDGRMLHSVLLEIFTDTGIGTQIVAGSPQSG